MNSKGKGVSILATCAGICGAVAIALAQPEDPPPAQVCSIWCGNPPVQIGSHTCAPSPEEYCCTTANCNTGQYAGDCCAQTENCEHGTNPLTGAPVANCYVET